MKIFSVVFCALISVSCGRVDHVSSSSSLASVVANDRYPIAPNASKTPGSLCETPTEYRYPEHIKYCHRSVDSGLKRTIMEEYDHDLGFHTTEMERMSFKIDHHIPLCMGGSNEQNNLWPQHSSVYQLTDPLEPLLCNIMSAGKIQQAEAVRIIHEVKQDPNTTDARIQELNATYHM